MRQQVKTLIRELGLKEGAIVAIGLEGIPQEIIATIESIQDTTIVLRDVFTISVFPVKSDQMVALMTPAVFSVVNSLAFSSGKSPQERPRFIIPIDKIVFVIEEKYIDEKMKNEYISKKSGLAIGSPTIPSSNMPGGLPQDGGIGNPIIT